MRRKCTIFEANLQIKAAHMRQRVWPLVDGRLWRAAETATACPGCYAKVANTSTLPASRDAQGTGGEEIGSKKCSLFARC